MLLYKAKDIFSVFKPSREFTWYVVLLLLSNIILYNLLISRMDSSLVEQSADSMLSDSTITYPAPHDFVIDSLRYAVKGKFKIEVSARDNTVLSLSHNGRFVETLLSREEGFSFEDIQLSRGENTFEIFALNPNGKSIRIDAFTLNYKAPLLDYLMQPIYRIKTDEKKIVLTFDGGSSNRGSKEILDILKGQNVKCTIFITGQFIENFPQLVQRMIDDGHELGNHSYNHPHLTNLELDGTKETRKRVSQNYFTNQLNVTDSLFRAGFKKQMAPFWRAPYGEINPEILYWAAELGYRHIGWSHRCDSWDWVAEKTSSLYRSSQEIKDHFLRIEDKDGLEGKIILMHLGSERTEDHPYHSLESLIEDLKKRGYAFVKVSQLLKKDD